MGITWFFKIETIKKIQITRWVKYVLYQLETIKTIADLVQMSVTLYFTIYTAGYTLPTQIQAPRSLGDRSLKLLSNTPNPERKRRRRSLKFLPEKPSCYCYYCKIQPETRHSNSSRENLLLLLLLL